ncbi:MAG: phosphoadenylyl-sulfate reductase [Pigmentiphaga sp.]
MWNALLDNLAQTAANHPDVVMASSLAAEDMLLTHAIHEAGVSVAIFTLDTGRLHPDTLAMIDRVREHYGIQIDRRTPDADAVAAHVQAHGEFAFYESLELRKACCDIRKVVPLRRALSGRSAWITGQRRAQAVSRGQLELREDDSVFGLIKYNPLAAWEEADVWREIHARGIPYNPLHDAGYPSIGCDPCTRPIRPGEDPRAGRWWWELADQKECGLHAGNLGGRQTIPIRPIADASA